MTVEKRIILQEGQGLFLARQSVKQCSWRIWNFHIHARGKVALLRSRRDEASDGEAFAIPENSRGICRGVGGGCDATLWNPVSRSCIRRADVRQRGAAQLHLLLVSTMAIIAGKSLVFIPISLSPYVHWGAINFA